MIQDRSGAPTGIANAAARQHWDDMTAAFLAHGAATPGHLGALMDADPDLALPVALKGLFCVMLARREMTDEARRCAETAKTLLAQGDECVRARAYLNSLQAWLAGDPQRAVSTLETYLEKWPSDSLTAKLIHGMRFMIGDASGMLSSVERVLSAHGNDHAYRGYILGCHAFALEETGQYDRAEHAGRAGLDLAKDDAWGMHAVAHVYDMTHRPTLGIALIEHHTDGWAHCNNFGYHVWWHKALLHLDQGEIDTVLSLYDEKIRRDKTDDYRDISNATSLLMRLELEGVEVGDRWDELVGLAEDRCDDGQLVFADLHYMLALIHRPEAQQTRDLATHMQQRATATTPVAAIARDPGQAAVAGLCAFGEGRYDTAFGMLKTAMAGLQRVGGSHAQRDVFERVTIDAGLRAGRWVDTEALLRARVEKRAGAQDNFAVTRFARIAQHSAEAMKIPAQ